ncbi:MAG: 50S ribosomal protein L9 [Lachnospiraceae bacterium]|nr:50S ribosomal protein L9 [Lachnospiraceae bacterium]
MEIILLEDVKSLGKKGEIVKVNDGYARNCILPKKLGVEATKKNLAELKGQQRSDAKKAQEILEEAQALSKELEKSTVEVKMKVGEGGKTFGTVSTKEIAAAMKEQLKKDIDKKKIIVPDAIKSLGMYEIKVKLHPQVTATMKVHVSEK